MNQRLVSVSTVLPLAVFLIACAGVRSHEERCEERGGIVKEVVIEDLPEEGGGPTVRHYCEVDGKVIDQW